MADYFLNCSENRRLTPKINKTDHLKDPLPLPPIPATTYKLIINAKKDICTGDTSLEYL